ncbi:radical SAM protein [Patescibacteria group bacterium]|nr:radical SAM protein [Patescibacteria group bacterium]
MRQTSWNKDNRVFLHKVLPLDTPFSLVIGASSTCNFKCKYCIHALSNDRLKDINFILKIMSNELFTKIIHDVNTFPNKIKSLQFSKDGEPLMNKKLPEMIHDAKRSDKFERVELITNGTLLTPEINLKLIDAGLDTMRISLQGISAEGYHKITGIHIDFENFLETITHFYRNKKNCKLHLKMIDIGIDGDKDIDTFHDIFDDMCDEISIQYTIPYFNDYINYDTIQKDSTINLFGNKNETVHVCPRPFMSISVSTDGSVMPCCRENIQDLVLGDAKHESIFDLWNSEKMRMLRILHLKKKRHEHVICKNCCIPDKITYDSDNLDKHSNNLSKYYEHR